MTNINVPWITRSSNLNITVGKSSKAYNNIQVNIVSQNNVSLLLHPVQAGVILILLITHKNYLNVLRKGNTHDMTELFYWEWNKKGDKGKKEEQGTMQDDSYSWY